MGLLIDKIKGLVQIQAKPVFETRLYQVPGIATAAAYATGDAMGVIMQITVPFSGKIQAARFYDKDLESIAKELWCFRDQFTVTADNGAFAPTDADLENVVAVVPISTFYGANVNSIGSVDGLAISYVAPTEFLYCQLVTRGADNIAASNIPLIRLYIDPD